MSDVRIVRDDATPYLRVLTARLRDLAPSLSPLVGEIRRYFGEVFDTEGAAAGARWAPLSEATMRQKARAGKDLRPLVLDGTLMDSLALGGGYGYADLGPRELRVGTTDPAAALVSGGTRRMPARDVVGDPGPARFERWADILADSLLQG